MVREIQWTRVSEFRTCEHELHRMGNWEQWEWEWELETKIENGVCECGVWRIGVEFWYYRTAYSLHAMCVREKRIVLWELEGLDECCVSRWVGDSNLEVIIAKRFEKQPPTAPPKTSRQVGWKIKFCALAWRWEKQPSDCKSNTASDSTSFLATSFVSKTTTFLATSFVLFPTLSTPI